MTSLALLGCYKVDVSPEERSFITAEVTGNEDLTNQELADLVLLELLVSEATSEFDVGLLEQEDSAQAPWLERYFDADGVRYLGEEVPRVSEFRVCFFLHHFQARGAIRSPYGNVPVDAVPVTAVPDRIASVCTYEHPG
jgi:hypothetical protein